MNNASNKACFLMSYTFLLVILIYKSLKNGKNYNETIIYTATSVTSFVLEEI